MNPRTCLVAILGLLLVATSTTTATAQQSARIINGTPAGASDSMVRIVANVRTGPNSGNSFECGGTLIHPQWVLTAAHCVHTDRTRNNGGTQSLLAPEELRVGIGIEDYTDTAPLDPDGEVHRIAEIVPHPDWRTDLSGSDYVVQGDDLALLRLEGLSALPVQRFVQQDQTGPSAPGRDATLLGFGLHNRGEAADYRGNIQDLSINGTSPHLERVVVPIRACGAVAFGLLCAGDPSPYDPPAGSRDATTPPGNDGCNGDSGGPLLVQDGAATLQVGLVSYGFFACGYTDAGGEPAAYTDLADYASWIHQQVGPLVTVTGRPAIEGTDGNVVFDVRAAWPLTSGDPTQLHLVAAGGDATPGEDHADDPIVVDLDGRTEATIEIPLFDDDLHEPHESVLLLQDDSPIELFSLPAATIVDDDVIAMSGVDAQAAEPEREERAVALTFTLDTPASGFESFSLRDASGATDRYDLDTGGIVLFEPGATEAVATVRVLDDDAVEEDEVAELVLVDPVGVALDAPVRLTITDDDERVVRVLAGEDRLATAIEVSRDAFADASTDTVVLASARSFPDALVGTPLAVARRGPLLLTEPEDLDGRVLAEIDRVLRPEGRVIVLGGTVAVSRRVQDRLQAAGVPSRRLAGATRFATAYLVADEVGLDGGVFVATGRNFPDALAAGSAAAVTGGVVLLTDDARLPDETAGALARSRGQVVTVGGQAAAALPRATRIVGATRYDTAQLVARTFFTDPPAVGLATGQSFPDALSGGVSAALRGGPLVLTTGAELSAETASYLDDLNPDAVRVFGGPSAVSTATTDQVASRTGAVVIR